MSVFDLAKNNRGNDKETVTMSYKTFDEYLHKAQTEERERIIALLADERSEMSHHSNYYNDPFGFAITLIKGEQ